MKQSISVSRSDFRVTAALSHFFNPLMNPVYDHVISIRTVLYYICVIPLIVRCTIILWTTARKKTPLLIKIWHTNYYKTHPNIRDIEMEKQNKINNSPWNWWNMVAVRKGQSNTWVDWANHSVISKILQKALALKCLFHLPWTPEILSGGDNTSVALKCKWLIQRI